MDFVLLCAESGGCAVLNYAFLEDIADFDPTAFQLPERLQKSEGPPVEVKPVAPQVQRLAEQVQREINRSQPPETTPSQPQASAETKAGPTAGVKENLQQQLMLSVSDQRAEALKTQLHKLKALPPDCASDDCAQTLMKALAVLQQSYRAEYAPKDLSTMSVLHPLLKCQALKWDQLKAQELPEIPAPEAGYLQKLRQLKGSLGALERAILYQLILAINAAISAHLSAADAVAPIPGAGASAPPEPIESSPAALAAPAPVMADFDPLKASREIMQLRAKLQRTYSASEKQALQQELTRLTQAQQGYFQQRQSQALTKGCQDFEADLRRLSQPERLTHASLEQWRKLRLTGLQGLLRLFSQPAEPLALACFESAMRQLARLGMPDAREQHQRESQNLLPTLTQATADLKHWQKAFDALFDQALLTWATLGLRQQAAEMEKKLGQLAKIQQDWQDRQGQLQALESAYLQADLSERQALKQTLLQAYAEMLAQLPPLNE